MKEFLRVYASTFTGFCSKRKNRSFPTLMSDTRCPRWHDAQLDHAFPTRRENGGSNGDAAAAAAAKKDGSTGAVSPSSARSTPASGASGNDKAKVADGKVGDGALGAVPAKMSPPAARALAGLGKELTCLRYYPSCHHVPLFLLE